MRHCINCPLIVCVCLVLSWKQLDKPASLFCFPSQDIIRTMLTCMLEYSVSMGNKELQLQLHPPVYSRDLLCMIAETSCGFVTLCFCLHDPIRPYCRHGRNTDLNILRCLRKRCNFVQYRICQYSNHGVYRCITSISFSKGCEHVKMSQLCKVKRHLAVF